MQQEVWVLRSEGYGELVVELDGLLDDLESVTVPFQELVKLVEGEEQWFYNLSVIVEVVGGQVELGVHDSTALFLVGSDDVLGTIDLSAFQQVAVAP